MRGWSHSQVLSRKLSLTKDAVGGLAPSCLVDRMLLLSAADHCQAHACCVISYKALGPRTHCRGALSMPVCEEHAPWLAKLLIKQRLGKTSIWIRRSGGRKSMESPRTCGLFRLFDAALLFASLVARGIASNTAPEGTLQKTSDEA